MGHSDRRVMTNSTSDIDWRNCQRIGLIVVPQNVHCNTRYSQVNMAIASDKFYGMLSNVFKLPATQARKHWRPR